MLRWGTAKMGQYKLGKCIVGELQKWEDLENVFHSNLPITHISITPGPHLRNILKFIKIIIN